jgi:hypothetical protein
MGPDTVKKGTPPDRTTGSCAADSAVLTVEPGLIDLPLQRDIPPSPRGASEESCIPAKPPSATVGSQAFSAKHPIDQLYGEPDKQCCTIRSKGGLIALGIGICLLCGAVVGPVYYTQVVLPNDRARAAALASALPPITYKLPPLTTQFLDEFTSINMSSWSYVIGDGSDRAWDFKGWGNQELQVGTGYDPRAPGSCGAGS